MENILTDVRYDYERRKSGIEAIGDVHWGTHFCLFYENKEDLLDILLPYFKAGLENNEYCMWITSEPLKNQEAEIAAIKAIPNFEKYLEKKQIEIIPYDEWYLKDIEFDLQRVLYDLIEKLDSALENGFDGLRITGNTTWLEKKNWKAFTDYEEEINNIISNYKMMAICTYSLEKCGPYEILDVIHNHEFALIRREGNWINFKSMEQIKVEEKLKESQFELEKLNHELEQKVEKRIKNLKEEMEWAVESEGFLKGFINSAEEAFYIYDSELRLIKINNSALNMLHIERKAALGKHMLELSPILKKTGRYDMYIKVLETGNPLSLDSVVSLPEFGNMYLNVKGFKAGDGLGIIVSDITERKKAEQKLSESEEKLRNFNIELTQRIEERTKELKESEEKYRTITEQSLLGIGILQDDVFKYVNNQFADIFGYSIEEILRWQPGEFINLVHLEDRSKAIEQAKKKQIGASSVIPYYQMRCITKTKEIIWIDIFSKTIDYEGRNADLITFIDITGKKIAGEKLRKSEEKYRLFIENAQEGIWAIDQGAYTTFANPKMAEILGYSVDEMIGKHLFDFMDEDGVKNATYYLEKREQGIKEQHDFIFQRKDGRFISTILETAPMNDEDGNYLGAIACVVDITERKKVEVKLIASEKFSKSVIDSMKDGLAVLNSQAIHINVNPAFCAMTGFSREELIGSEIPHPFWPEEDYQNIKVAFKKVLDGDFGDVELIFKRKNGELFPVSISPSRILDDDGNVINYFATVKDITERKETEKKIGELAKFPSENPNPVLRVTNEIINYSNKIASKMFNISEGDDIPATLQDPVKEVVSTNENKKLELELNGNIYSFILTPVEDATYVNIYGMEITNIKKAEEELINLNKLKSELLTRASHELKTPLISIKGYSDLLLELHKDKFDEMTLSSIKQIKRGCNTLEKTVNNILNTTYLDSGQAILNLTVEDLSFLIKFVVNDLKGLALTRNHEISVNIQDNLITKLEKERIYEVLSNLVVNAIKYTPPGGHIEIKSEKKNGSYVISVKDNGIGFTKEEKELIFKQFGKIERYGQGWDIGIEGTGLGLHISKKIIELHGGKIWMESIGRNKGSTFNFSLPII